MKSTMIHEHSPSESICLSLVSLRDPCHLYLSVQL